MANILKKFPVDLRIILIYLLFTFVFLTVPPLNETFIRIILGLPMVLFIPGYALIAALFPCKDDLDGIERMALSFGLSIAVVPLIGLGLNYTPWGIRFWPILISLILFTFILVLIATRRRNGISPEKRFTLHVNETYSGMKYELFSSTNRIDRILSIILIISIIASLVMLVYVIVTPKQGEKFTEFYILGPKGMADDYQREINTGKPINLIVGVVNHEYSGINYTLYARIGNTTYYEDKIRLLNNQTWQEPISFKINQTGTNLKLQFLLYRDDNNSAPYRDTHLWINSTH